MLELALLGEQRVALRGCVVALRSSRALALLAYLALHRGAPQRRAHLSGLFWPDSTDGQARTNLRRELHLLRSGLPGVDRFLVANGGTLLWRVDHRCRLDVAVFEGAAKAAEAACAAEDETTLRVAAAAAVRAYRGELTPALYDDWVVAERGRLHNCCVALLDRLIDLERAVGNFAAAIEWARRRVDLEPLEEVGYRRLLRLQASSGDRGAALRTYYRCVSVLEREFGLGPDQATTAEYDRLAGVESAGLAGPRAHLSAASAAGPPRLVGRERELAILRGLWHEAADGAAGFAVVSGEAGVGKSRLLDELAAIAQRSGGAVARARCFAASAVRRSRRPAAGSIRSGRGRWTGLSRRATGARPLRHGRWPTHGGVTGSSKGWPALYSQPASQPCSRSMTCSGATRTPSRGCSCCFTSARVSGCSWSPRPGAKRLTTTPS